MKKLFIVLGCLACGLLLLSACSSSKSVKRSGDQSAAAKKAGEGLTPISMSELSDAEAAQVKKILDDLEDVPFDFDSYTIPTQGLDIIRKNVATLNQMLEEKGRYIRIIIEGHTDERGTDEYNLGLGERRAKTVKEYLLNVGFREEQARIISYGEEKPKVEGSSVEAWDANRRVHFVVE